MHTDKDVTVSVLGAGVIGTALLDGLLAAGFPPYRLRATTRSSVSAHALRSRSIDVLSTEEQPLANSRATKNRNLVVVAVEPPAAAALLSEVASALAPGTAVVTMVAGLSCSVVERTLPPGTAVLRAVPNTAIRMRQGVTLLSASDAVSQQTLGLVTGVFDSCGLVLPVPEPRLPVLIPLASSGPAYVFHLMEQWQQAVVRFGVDRDEAAMILKAVFAGAGALLGDSGRSPSQLRQEVATRNGMTERAIAVLDDAGLPDVFQRAFQAAITRGEQLAGTDATPR